VARQDAVEVPKEIQMLHKRVTLSIDIFFVNGIPYFATLSMKICFLSVTHLSNRKIPTIFKAFKAMHNYYLQRGFQIVYIKGDGEFKPLKDLIESELFGGPAMNLTSANEHVPEIERKIRVIKERLCAIIYSMPVNAVPSLVMIHVVMFVAKALNIFPVKGGILGWSPKQIILAGTPTCQQHVGPTRQCRLIFPERACRGDTRHAKRGPDIPNLYQ
jgi:hypothetical protein